MIRFFIALGFILALGTSALAHKTPSSDAETIKANITAMWAAVEAGDVDGYIDYIHPNYSLFGESDLYLQSGKALERASYTDYLGRYKNIRTFMHQPEVTVRGDTAWITYYWSDSGISKKDGARFTSKGKSTRIFVKENGKWLCIHGHFTAVE
ncbi:MAG: nuclear transport factor 2 family protein [Hellea sp.]